VNRFVFATLLLIATLLITFSAPAQVKQGKTRPAQTKQIMSGLVKPNGTAIGKATKSPPTDDEGWKALATNAALLNEASYLLMDDGRCPDADWENAAMALRAATEAVLKNIEAKNIDGVAGQNPKINAACAACHRAHKK